MKPETAEAYQRLVSTFVAAIEGTGADVPEKTVEKLASEPLAACEELNEFALSCGAVSDEVDAALAAIYESMDAADARGPVDEDCVRHIVAAWTDTHVERPVAEPEPTAEPEAVASEAETVTPTEEQTAERPKRRRSRKAKEVREEGVEATSSVAGQGEAPTESVDVKPGRRSRAKARAAKQADGPSEAKSAEKPKAQADATTTAKTEEKLAEPAPENSSEETLGVDQAVAILGVSRPTIYKLIEAGELSAHKKGRSWRISAASVAEKAASSAKRAAE